MPKFVYRSRIAASAPTVFAWHEAQGAFERLVPPWASVQVDKRQGGINGGSVTLIVSHGPIKIRWSLKHDQYIAGVQFRDYQVEGPFKSWTQVHRVEADGKDGAYLIDTVEYELPEILPAKFMATFYIASELKRLFHFRHSLIGYDLEKAARYQGGRKMKVLLSGSTGMIGSALVPLLLSHGHAVTRLIRPDTKSKSNGQVNTDTIDWNPKTGEIDIAALSGFDAVVHLAGANIADGRWTEVRKKELIDSRIESTRLLSTGIAKTAQPPKVLIAASAIGYYGDRGQEEMSEAATKGTGFLADLCKQWEDACEPAAKAGIKVVNLRIGVVLSTTGGALAKMLLPFELGAGGQIGSGNQQFSWVSLDDVTGAILHILNTDSLEGPINATAPTPVTNKEFTRALGKVLCRPTLIPIPSFGLRALFGQMADECLIAGQKVMPTKLVKSNYQFRDTEIESALRRILGK